MKLAIIKVEPINFSLRNQQEKDIIINTFQKFLNSLDSPMQIVIATDILNLDAYLTQLSERVETVSQQTENNYSPIFEDFRNYLTSIISSQKLLNRSFYVVIPEKEEIAIQLSVCEELLKNMNLRFQILRDDELKYLLSGFFNDLYQEEEKSHPPDPNDALHYEISPKNIINNPNELQR